MKLFTTLLAASIALALAGCKTPPKPPPASAPASAPAAMTPELELQLARMQVATERLARDNAELRKSLVSLTDAQKKSADLAEKLQQAQNANAELQAANDKLQDALDLNIARLDEARAAMKVLDERTRVAEAGKHDAEIKSLADQNAQLREQLKDVRQAIRDTQKEFREQMDWDQLQQQLLKQQYQNALLAWLMQQRVTNSGYYPGDWYYPPTKRHGRPWPPTQPHHGGTVRVEDVPQQALPGSIDGGKLIKSSTIDGGKLIQASDINGGGGTRNSGISGGSLIKASTIGGGRTINAADAGNVGPTSRPAP